jgi:hypothetical protein
VVAPATCLTVQTPEAARGSGIGRGSVDRERVYAPMWAGSLSKLGQSVFTNGLNSPDTYRLKYHIYFIYFIFG